jgi:hypothetical protein
MQKYLQTAVCRKFPRRAWSGHRTNGIDHLVSAGVAFERLDRSVQWPVFAGISRLAKNPARRRLAAPLGSRGVLAPVRTGDGRLSGDSAGWVDPCAPQFTGPPNPRRF